MGDFRMMSCFFVLLSWILASNAQATHSEPNSPFPTSALRKYVESHPNFSSVLKSQRFADTDTVGNSQGYGGQSGSFEYSFTASNGKTANFKAIIPDDIGPRRSYGMLIYLHGDGGSDYNWFFSSVQEVANTYQLIPVAILSPTANVNGPSWWWDADNNALFLDELLKDQFLNRYNINQRQVIFSGASGGPTFLNGPWLRYYASQYRGGAVLLCGGIVQTQLPFRDSEGYRKHFPLYYISGTNDFLLSYAESAMSYYQREGMQVFAEFPEGAGHCTYPMGGYLSDRVGRILANGQEKWARAH